MKILPDQPQEADQDPVLAHLGPVQVLQDQVQVQFDHGRDLLGRGLVPPGPALAHLGPALAHLGPAQALQDHVRAQGRNPGHGHGQDQSPDLDPGPSLGPGQGMCNYYYVCF